MSNLENVLADYLNTKTNYAFLITGKWGSGKTYYYKNHLTKIIKSTSTLVDNSKKYRPIHISLFGLTSIEDIQTQIFLSLNIFLKNKVVKLSAGLGKSLARGIFAIKNLGNFDDYISDVKPHAGDWININDLVICFDDLERRSERLPLEELIGFINSLVENNDAKILIIANNDKIEEKIYDELKEKTVGVSIEFQTNFEEKLALILEDRYKESFSSYYQFLNENKNLILEYSKSFNDNFRILIFSLDKFHNIYSELKNNILDINSKYENIIKEKLENIFQFSLSISIEYKKNNISYNKRKEIDKAGGYSDFLFLVDEKDKKEPTFRESFLKEYFKSRDDYFYYNTIFAYITGANKFIIKEFLNEISSLYHLDDNEIMLHYKIMRELNYKKFIQLTEIQYRKKTSQIVGFAENGLYGLEEYLAVFHYATRFENPLRYSPKKLENRLISGINKVSFDNKHIYSLDMYLDINVDSPYKLHLEEIKKACVKKNDKIREVELKNEAKNLIYKLENNWSDFKNIVFNPKEKWKYTPFLQHASSYKIYIRINKFDFEKLRELRLFIKDRYSGYKLDLRQERKFIQDLKNRLEPNSNKRNKKNVKNYLLNEIYNDLDKIIDSWN